MPAEPPPSSTSQSYDAAIGLSWFALPLFAIVTVIAMTGEMFTSFADVGPGYYLIMLGMPAFCAGWLYLLIYATLRPVPASWPTAALAAAGAIVIAYWSIG